MPPAASTCRNDAIGRPTLRASGRSLSSQTGPVRQMPSRSASSSSGRYGMLTALTYRDAAYQPAATTSSTQRVHDPDNYWHAVVVYEMDDSLVMIIGGNRAGDMIEVGYVIRDGMTLIVHAMRPARSKFLPKR